MSTAMLQNPRTSKGVYPRTPFWRAGPIPGRTTCGHLGQRAFQTLACCVPPGPGLGRAGFVLRTKLFVKTLNLGEGTPISTQPQNSAPGMFDHAPGLERDLLHHYLHAPPVGRMAQGCVFADECVLTRQAQDVYALARASDGFCLGARVVHQKGVPFQGHVAARQGTKVHRANGVLGQQQSEVELWVEFKPRGCMGVHALAQGRASGDCANVQGPGKEGITPALLNGIEAVLALDQQA